MTVKEYSEGFTGFYPETFDFLAQIALHNDKAYFESCRAEYIRYVKDPLLAFERELAGAVGEIDPQVRTGPKALSRIYRDTRFSKDKSPLRDHAWIAYRPPEKRLSESLCFYFEITPVSFGYGLGMYNSHPAFMTHLRERIQAQPGRFHQVLSQASLWERFALSGEDFVRPKIPDAKPPLDKLVNKRYFSMIHHSNDLNRALLPELAQDVCEGFTLLAPLYRLIIGKEA